VANIKKQLDSLLNQEMDRKNFLRYSGSILLAVIGVSGLIKLLLSSSKTPILPEQQKGSGGYGSSRYGQ
jgi:hypothetical protein